ncbi:hypothetical protein, partial [Jatrophihabitans endophyticus]|uniref:hypothetical protein n=1 Tax=Jatrophihabitans endophyticus TaxID=1206085 RepID=UPI0019DA97C9
MSLVAFAMRIATVRAIRAVIWPDFVVADSPQRPLALLEQGKPLVAVYTGHDADRMEGRELYAGDPRVTLTIQVFLPAELTITTSGGQVLALDTRKAGAETVLDVVARRVLSAFLDAGATPNPWSELWQRLLQTT